MKKKLGIMLSTSVFIFSGFGMELQQDVSSTKSSTVTVQTAMTEDMEDKSAEQIDLQKMVETIEIIKKNMSNRPLAWYDSPFVFFDTSTKEFRIEYPFSPYPSK